MRRYVFYSLLVLRILMALFVIESVYYAARSIIAAFGTCLKSPVPETTQFNLTS